MTFGKTFTLTLPNRTDAKRYTWNSLSVFSGLSGQRNLVKSLSSSSRRKAFSISVDRAKGCKQKHNKMAHKSLINGGPTVKQSLREAA